MNIIRKENRLCPSCMTGHDVQTVLVDEKTTFKNIPVAYEAEYQYCENTDELFAEEGQISANDIRMKDAYRKSMGLLTSGEIIAIRSKYGISQSDLSLLLGWGGKTIARYETHQVQDAAHNAILKKLSSDPEWFLSLLADSGDLLSPESRHKYTETAAALYEGARDLYLEKTISTWYVHYRNENELHGNTPLALDKVSDMIRYYANSDQVTKLYKVKLMKLLWYADALAFKRRNRAISGLIYQAMPMGAVPMAHDYIIDLPGILYEEKTIGDGTAYLFLPTDDKSYPSLSDEETAVINTVIQTFGKANNQEIVSAMHEEEAYRETAPRDIIQYKYTLNLSLT